MPRLRADNLSLHHDLVWSAILDGMARLMAVKSYDQITLAEIAAASGMARNTIYNYAPDKTGLFAAAAEMTSGTLLKQIAELAEGPGLAAHRLEAIVGAILRWFGSDPHRHIVVQSLFQTASDEIQARASAPLSAMLGHVGAVLSEGVKAGEFQAAEAPALRLQLMAGVMRTAVERVAAAPAQIPDVEREVIDFLLRALRPTSPER